MYDNGVAMSIPEMAALKIYEKAQWSQEDELQPFFDFAYYTYCICTAFSSTDKYHIVKEVYKKNVLSFGLPQKSILV